MTSYTPFPLTSQYLDAAAAKLQAHGIAFSREDCVLRCELPATGSPVCIVSAENVFVEDRSREDVTSAAWDIGDALFTEKTKVLPHLVIVGDTAAFTYLGHRIHRECVETDRYSPAKRVMSLEELPAFFSSVFPRKAFRANDAPKVTLLRYLQYGQSPLSSATHVFDREDELDQFRKHTFGGLTTNEQAVANRVYRKIMGSVHHIAWSESGPGLARLNDVVGIPQELSSAGERTALAFSAYLSRMANQVVPGMCLGLHNFFNGMDDLKRFDAFGCVGEFIEATGASVLIQSEKGDTRKMAKAALHPYVEKLNLLIVEQESETKAATAV